MSFLKISQELELSFALFLRQKRPVQCHICQLLHTRALCLRYLYSSPIAAEPLILKTFVSLPQRESVKQISNCFPGMVGRCKLLSNCHILLSPVPHSSAFTGLQSRFLVNALLGDSSGSLQPYTTWASLFACLFTN